MPRAAVLGVLAAVTLFVGNNANADHAAVVFGADAAGPITTIQAVPSPEGAFAVGLVTQYSNSNTYSADELANFAGQHVHAHSSDYLLMTSLGTSYGLTDDLTLSARLPYIYRNDFRAGTHSHSGGVTTNGMEELGDSAGLGDASILGKYRFLNATENKIQAAALLGMELPTGDTHEKADDGERFETEHQPGSGSWDPMFGLAVTKTFNRVSLDASVLYVLNTEGAQDTNLGDQFFYNAALSYRLTDSAHHHDSHTAPHSDSAWDAIVEINGEWQDQNKVEGEKEDNTGGTEIFLSPGIRFISGDAWSANLSFGIPIVSNLRRSHPDTEYRVLFGISKGF